MTEERLKLYEKAEVRINAIIDTLSQDKGGLANKLKYEDVKNFLISLWVDCATETTKEMQEYIEIANKLETENKELKNELQQSKEIIIDVLSILTEDIPIGVISIKSYNKYLMCDRIKKFLKGEIKL